LQGANNELKRGVHEWECVLQQYDAANGYNVIIGVVPSYWTNWSYAGWIGGSAQSPGWGFITGNGYKTGHNTGQQYYGPSAPHHTSTSCFALLCDLCTTNSIYPWHLVLQANAPIRVSCKR
jgi:hypothetical protein